MVQNISNVLNNIYGTKTQSDVIKLLQKNNCLQLAIKMMHSCYGVGEIYLYLKLVHPTQNNHSLYKFVSNYPLSMHAIQHAVSEALFDRMYDIYDNNANPNMMTYKLPKFFNKADISDAPMIVGWSLKHFGFDWIIHKIINKSDTGLIHYKPQLKIQYGKVDNHKLPYFANSDNTPAQIDGFSGICNTISDWIVDKYQL